MATLRVSNASQLNSAIRSAGNGDTIALKAGSYGSITVNGISKSITLTSESGSNPASLSGLTLRNSANIKVDDLKFTGSGNAVAITDSRNITVQDSIFNGNKKGIAVNRADDITIRNNDFTKMHNDAIALTGVDGAQIIGNQVKNMATGGGAHHDMIQIHPTQGASSNITIRNNVLDSNDTFTQAIYIGSGTTHKNFTIDNNTITSGHKYGIQVFSTVRGLDITDNVVIQDRAVNSTGDRYVPEINVSRSSSNVEITGNTAHEIFSGSGSDWKVGNNTIVKPGSVVTGGGADTGTGGGSTDAGSGTTADSGSGGGNTVTIDGDSVNGWTKVVARNMDLDGGDSIRLKDFDAGTFVNGSDGNPLAISDGGRAVTIDSRADVAEVIARSPGVQTKVEGDDTLVLRLSQDDGTLAMRLVDIGGAKELLSGNTGGSSGDGSSGSGTDTGSGRTVSVDGDSVNGWTKVVARNMDLDGGDTIRLKDFDAGTFVNGSDGNALAVSDGGRAVTIDSRADVAEIIDRSPGVQTKVEGDDTLVLRLSQDDGTLALRLVDLGNVDALL